MRHAWTLLLTFFVIVALALGGGAYFSAVRTEKVTAELSHKFDTLNQKIVSSQPVAASAGDWKTYDDKTFGIHFQYPASWTLGSGGQKDHLLTVIFNGPGRCTTDCDMPPAMQLDIYHSITDLDNPLLYGTSKKLDVKNLQDYLTKYSKLADPVYMNVTKVQIGGLSGYQADLGPNQFTGGQTFFAQMKNGNILKFWLWEPKDSPHILSSFTF